MDKIASRRELCARPEGVMAQESACLRALGCTAVAVSMVIDWSCATPTGLCRYRRQGPPRRPRQVAITCRGDHTAKQNRTLFGVSESRDHKPPKRLSTGARGAIAGIIWLTMSGTAVQGAVDALPSDVLGLLRERYVSAGLETRYLSDKIDLNGDRLPELIVYVVGPMACGTGGCPTLVLTPQGARHRLVSTISVTRPPIRASAASTKGWRNLIVHIAGGGGESADVELLFDGRSYPENPTVSGPRVKAANLSGSQILIQDFDSLEAAHPLSGEGGATDPAPRSEAGPSFDCAKATLEIEKLVCRDAELARMDRQLATRSGSGARYTNPSADFWEHQGEAAVTWSGESYTCEAR